MKTLISICLILTFLIPSLSFAQGGGTSGGGNNSYGISIQNSAECIQELIAHPDLYASDDFTQNNPGIQFLQHTCHLSPAAASCVVGRLIEGALIDGIILLCGEDVPKS